METNKRNKYLQDLHNGICVVTFTKANGEQRVMRCSLHHDLLPEIEPEKISGRKYSDKVIRVFDLDKQAFRSFTVDNVIDFKVEQHGVS